MFRKKEEPVKPTKAERLQEQCKKASNELYDAYDNLSGLKDNPLLKEEIRQLFWDVDTIGYLLLSHRKEFISDYDKKVLIDVANELVKKSRNILSEYVETCRRTYT